MHIDVCGKDRTRARNPAQRGNVNCGQTSKELHVRPRVLAATFLIGLCALAFAGGSGASVGRASAPGGGNVAPGLEQHAASVPADTS